MALKTAFTELLSVTHPVVLAPMHGLAEPIAGGVLAAAVSNAGGLGLIGGDGAGPEECEREIDVVVARTTKPWGIGFITWAINRQALEAALSDRPAAVMLNFGDPSPFADLVHTAGSVLIVGVTDLDEARQALAAGADVIVAQGSEAGGHGGRHATLPFVPAVVDLAAPTPVLAAGGIADGRRLAAALVLGASGAMLGTCFAASREAGVAPWFARSIVEGRGEDTERSRVTDISREEETGRASGPHASCATRSWSSGAGARTSSRQTPPPRRPMNGLLPTVTLRSPQCGRARAST